MLQKYNGREATIQTKQMNYSCRRKHHRGCKNPSSAGNDLCMSYKKAQLTLTNPRDSKGCKNCSNSACFVSFQRIPFPQISIYQCIASRGMFSQALGLYCYTQFEIRCLPIIKFFCLNYSI